ncbi:MAG TPA: VWA domain-containing protein [Bryobacteraceae bacterium]|jgi:VWFA-related protein
MRRVVAVASLLAAGAAAVSVFPLSASGDETGLIRADVRLVLLDVSVKNHDGAFVSGLTKDDFSVYENGREQNIKVFTSRDLPVTMGVVVDSSGSMIPKRYDVLRAAELLLHESNPSDEVFVLNFNESLRPGLPPGVSFSSDPKLLHDALYRGRPAGKTALYDAVIASLEQVKKGSRDRRMVVLISDGKDNASHHTRQDLLNQLEDSAATVYAIGLYERESDDQDPALLRKLARISGGEAYFPAELAQLPVICHKIANDIRERYTVGYTPAEGAAGAPSSELRQIRLHVKGPDNSKLIARSRSSYRYDQTADTHAAAANDNKDAKEK